MLNKKFFLGILVCMLPLSGLNAQTVTRTVNDYVLLDTDQNIGKIGERVNLYRISDGMLILVGKLEIVTFRDGRTAAKIVRLERGMTVAKGDFVPGADSPGLSALESGKDQSIYSSRQTSAKFAGIFLGGWAPSPELDQTLNPAFCLGARIKMVQWGRAAFYANAVFPFSSYKNEDNDYTMNLAGFHVLANFRLSPSVFLDIGPGFHTASFKPVILDEEAEDGTDSNSTTQSYAGFTAGISMLFAITDRIALAPEVNVSAFHMEDDWQTYARMGLSVHFDVW